MRIPVVLLLTCGLTACAPRVPDSGAGVGFTDYNSYLREQAAAAPRTPATAVAPFGTAMAPAPTGGFSPEVAAAAIDRASGTAAPLGAPMPVTISDPFAAPSTMVAGAVIDPNDPNRPRGNAPSTIAEQSGEMVHSNTGISDEQDFNAVASRETIESDAERIARNKAQYTVIQPTAVPERTETGPNIVAFALATTHNPGQQMYTRSALRLTDPMVACARYGSPDLAQQAFLAAGGPDRDRRGLDPDGDGFACAWDPRPFRLQ